MTAPAAVLGIGTASFIPDYGLPADARGAAVAEAPGDQLLRAALDAGVGYLDTAADYGDSEAAVGRVRRPCVRVCTKMAPAASLDGVHASIARLGGPPDTILMHSAGRDQIRSAPAIDALRDARSAGLTRKIGVSTYGATDANFALSREWVDAIQVEYSILNQSVARSIQRARPGQEVIVRSVLCKGLLTARRAAAPSLVEPLRDALEGIEACASEWGWAVEPLAIRFALDTPGIDVVLVGVSSQSELDAAVRAAGAPRLEPAQWDRLSAFDRGGVDAAHPERWARLS